MKAVAIVSGGMDSVTLLHRLHLMYQAEVHMLSFNYGQKHKKELEFATYWAEVFGLRHNIIDLSSITDLLNSSSLVSSSDEAIPEGHYAAENMKSTVVPNRNMMMLSIAAAVAVNNGAQAIATGVHGGDHHIYPDCRPEFLDAAEKAFLLGNEGFIKSQGLSIYAPYVHKDKTFIAREGNQLNVDWTKTWSCYKGSELHCGVCGTCVERIEALSDAGLDPTIYSFDREDNA